MFPAPKSKERSEGLKKHRGEDSASKRNDLVLPENTRIRTGKKPEKNNKGRYRYIIWGMSAGKRLGRKARRGNGFPNRFRKGEGGIVPPDDAERVEVRTALSGGLEGKTRNVRSNAARLDRGRTRNGES